MVRAFATPENAAEIQLALGSTSPWCGRCIETPAPRDKARRVKEERPLGKTRREYFRERAKQNASLLSGSSGLCKARRLRICGAKVPGAARD